MPEKVYTRFEDAEPPPKRLKKSHGHGPMKTEAEKLLPGRRKLPIWKHQEDLRTSIRKQKVTIIVGETGSGKSTQLPQFLLAESWCKEKLVQIDGNNVKVGGRIVVTQPRRVAAISLARRVAKEVGTPLGKASPASTVGYSVRFDHNASPSTLIKYVTEGTLLQEMLGDPWLRQYSAIVIDEVHERGVNVDLLLGFMKRMLESNFKGRGGIPLRIIIMSATADVDALRGFFESTNSLDKSTDEASTKSQVGFSLIEGRQFPVETIYSIDPVNDVLEECFKSILQINRKEALPGDILVFLYGQEAIESVERLLDDEAAHPDRNKGVPKLLVLPLFAALPQDAQQKVFSPTPPGTRKVILSTNIAETSITVSGVRFVVDCGKFKMKQFRTGLGLESLLCRPISKSSAEQRKGRAGREAPGKCWRLYTEKAYNEILPEATVPEILRCDLTHAILNMKARGVKDVIDFPLLDKPKREGFEEAMLQLLFVGALTKNGEISKIGSQIAKLPLSAPLGRVLIAAMEDEENILSEVVDIVSCLSVENIFLNLTTEEAKEKAEEARRSLFRREGDHLTLLRTVQGYASENTDRKAWSQKHFINHRAMRAVMDVRKHLRGQITSMHKHEFSDHIPSLTTDRAAAILKCFLKGFGRSAARLCPDGSYKTIDQDQVVAIHPSSVLHGRKVEAIMYNEYVFTTKSYARGVSVVQSDWVTDVLKDWTKRMED